MTPQLFNLLVFGPILLGTILVLIFLLLPYPVRLRLLAWKKGIKIYYFKTAASLYEHLQTQPGVFGKHEFFYEQAAEVFTYFSDVEPVTYTFSVHHFRVSASLKAAILALESTADGNFYQVDQLLPLARVEKLKLLVNFG